MRVAEHHAVFGLQLFQRFGIADVIAFAMGDGTGDDRAFRHVPGEERLVVLDFQLHFAADETQLRVAHQHTRKKPRLGDDLEAVADP